MRAVLWDMDGTLVDSEPLHNEAIAAILADHGIEVDQAFFDALIGMRIERVAAEVEALFGLTIEPATFGKLQIEGFVERAHRTPRLPGADLYESLREAGLPTGIVTNSDRIVTGATLMAAGLSEPLMITVCINDVRAGKPEPEPYLRAAHLLGVPPAQCLVVEDSATGATAGLAAGMRVLTLNYHGVPVEAPGAERMADFEALQAAVKDWMGLSPL